MSGPNAMGAALLYAATKRGMDAGSRLRQRSDVVSLGQYNSLIREYNELLAKSKKDYKKLLEENNSDIRDYNQLLDKYNGLRQEYFDLEKTRKYLTTSAELTEMSHRYALESANEEIQNLKNQVTELKNRLARQDQNLTQQNQQLTQQLTQQKQQLLDQDKRLKSQGKELLDLVNRLEQYEPYVAQEQQDYWDTL